MWCARRLRFRPAAPTRAPRGARGYGFHLESILQGRKHVKWNPFGIVCFICECGVRWNPGISRARTAVRYGFHLEPTSNLCCTDIWNPFEWDVTLVCGGVWWNPRISRARARNRRPDPQPCCAARAGGRRRVCARGAGGRLGVRRRRGVCGEARGRGRRRGFARSGRDGRVCVCARACACACVRVCVGAGVRAWAPHPARRRGADVPSPLLPRSPQRRRWQR